MALLGLLVAAVGALVFFGFVVWAMYDAGGWLGVLYLASILMVVAGLVVFAWWGDPAR